MLQFSGETADIRLYNCTTRKEIKVRHLSTPVTIEFQRKEETKVDIFYCLITNSFLYIWLP